MWETSGRLLRLLGLLQTHRDWSGAVLADRLAVTERTVRRDVDRLRELGYPVEARPGTGGGYRLGAGAVLPPLLLDDEEAVAIAVGLRSAAAAGLAGIEETALRALAKLDQVLPSRLRHRVQTLAAAVVPMGGTGPSVDVDTLLAVSGCIRDSQQLRADYTAYDGTPSRRLLEPARVVHAGWRWYLLAWDVDRAAWRTLRLDRLTPHVPVGPRFTPRPPPEPDVAAYTSRGITTGAYRWQARVTVQAPADRVDLNPTVGTVTPLDECTCTLTAGAHSLDELALHLGLLPYDLVVHEPPELLDRLGALAERLARLAER